MRLNFIGGSQSHHGLFFSLSTAVLFTSQTVNATKRFFQTSNDRRYIIAPIGEPFGFNEGGQLTVIVNDYKMTVSNSMPKKGKKEKEVGTGFFSSGKSSQIPTDEDENSFTGVFMLKRFATESEFLRFEEEIVEDPTQCLYNDFRRSKNERRLELDSFDDEYQDFDDESGDDYYDFVAEADDDYYDFVAEAIFDDDLSMQDILNYNTIEETDDIYDIDDLTDEFTGEDDGYYDYLLQQSVDPNSEDDTINFEDTFLARAPSVARDGLFLPMDNTALWEIQDGEDGAPALTYKFTAAEEGLYVLMYQVCPSSHTQMFSQVRSSFKLKMQTQNIDKFGRVSFLSAGELHLPLIFFFFSLCYFILAYLWNTNLTQKNSNGTVDVKAIHHLMTAVVIVKAISIFLESIRYHFISVKGHAQFFSFLYYSFTFVNSVLLFSVILLLGSGWSLVRSFLFQREKTIILSVLLLQIFNNLAVVFILKDTQGETVYNSWTSISHLIDIVCCCLIMLPIVWQVSALENQPDSDEKTATIRKLQLFKTFYLLVMTWIYFTRVVVYLVTTILSYKYTWVSSYITEFGTMIFFMLTGYYFRPDIRKNVSLNKTNSNGVDEEDAEYGDVEPLFVAGEVELPGQKRNID